jgi:hypothetical protein
MQCTVALVSGNPVANVFSADTEVGRETESSAFTTICGNQSIIQNSF